MYYILIDGEPVKTDADTWARWFRGADRNVARTEIGPMSGDTAFVYVSTVFLGLNHNYSGGPPLLYETLVFVDNRDGERVSIENSMLRYATRQDAEAGHRAVVQFVSDAIVSGPNDPSALGKLIEQMR